MYSWPSRHGRWRRGQLGLETPLKPDDTDHPTGCR
jgi:hypothetical protein